MSLCHGCVSERCAHSNENEYLSRDTALVRKIAVAEAACGCGWLEKLTWNSHATAQRSKFGAHMGKRDFFCRANTKALVLAYLVTLFKQTKTIRHVISVRHQPHKLIATEWNDAVQLELIMWLWAMALRNCLKSISTEVRSLKENGKRDRLGPPLAIGQ